MAYYTPTHDMEEIDRLEDLILNSLGAEEAYNALCRALDYDTKREMFDYIIRMYDVEGAEE